ncbi:SDR family NAD(P)-dependent oxidoreductase [Catenuloplanes indicus]|nr:SDR family NAD(P)-dependent oxidoreductase [Catenuloplanes indicus]
MRSAVTVTPARLPELLLHVSVVRPVFVWGAPGIGRSSLVRDFASSLGLECVSPVGTQLAAEDLIGVPELRDGRSRFAPPETIARDEPYCLFLDELNASSPEGSIVIGAGNRSTDGALARPMASALVNRLVRRSGCWSGPFGDPSGLAGAEVLAVPDVNVAGPVRVTTAFLPLLGRSADPVVINVSSAMGDLVATHDPARPESGALAPAYAASKAALTMLTTQYARALPGIRINAADPGYTATDLNGHTGPQTVTEGTDAVVALATAGPGRGSGRLVSRHGEITW